MYQSLIVPLVLTTSVLQWSCGKQGPSTAIRSSEPTQWIIEFWYDIAKTCEGYPSKENCDDGDMNLFNGLLCAAGEDLSCEAVAAGQGSDGRWWRSPRRVDGQVEQNRTFSRDMALGSLLYLATKQDVDRAQKWLEWIEDNRPCVLRNPVTGGCTLRGNWRLCRDENNSSCDISPALWGQFFRVWQHLGLEPSSIMKKNKASESLIAVEQAKRQKLGYSLHLSGVSAFLKGLLDQDGAIRRELAAVLHSRQPLNPFFRWLHEGSTSEVESMVLDRCPTREKLPGRYYQWAWERRDDSLASEDSMVWECIFMGKLLWDK